MRFFLDLFFIIVCSALALFMYHAYWEDFKAIFFDPEPEHTIFVGSAAVAVSVADDHQERVQGLSGVRSLREREGKLFIFDNDGKHGIWMKDMLFPIDIIWIDRELTVVDIKENVHPSTFPEIFAPQYDARYVLEMNALFVSSLKVKVGDRVTLPPALLPSDIKEDLRE